MKTEEEKKESKKISAKKWRDNNKSYIKKKSKEYREKNKLILKQKAKDRRIKKGQVILSESEKIEKKRKSNEKWLNKNKNYFKKYREKNFVKIKNYQKEYQKENKTELNKKIQERRKRRYKEDGMYKIKTLIRHLIVKSFKRNGFTKKSKTIDILGCSYEFLKSHLESKFEFWMNWDNKGLYNGEFNYGWDIDHIIPLSSAKTEEEIIKLNHFSNLQPLCSKINRDIKRNNINYEMD